MKQKLEWYVLFLEEYIKDLELSNAWYDFNEKTKDLNKIKDLLVHPWPQQATNSCSKCGLRLEGVMGYVCSQPMCPTGLGGVWCSNG
jgi:hypothetical protein